jgi:hypothetical protein
VLGMLYGIGGSEGQAYGLGASEGGEMRDKRREKRRLN